MLLELRAAGKDWKTIYERLNELPGPRIGSVEGCYAQYNKLKNSMASSASAQAKATPEFITASHEEIRQWAGQRGLVTAREPLDIGVVNQKRRTLGLPPFVEEAKAGKAIGKRL